MYFSAAVCVMVLHVFYSSSVSWFSVYFIVVLCHCFTFILQWQCVLFFYIFFFTAVLYYCFYYVFHQYCVCHGFPCILQQQCVMVFRVFYSSSVCVSWF